MTPVLSFAPLWWSAGSTCSILILILGAIGSLLLELRWLAFLESIEASRFVTRLGGQKQRQRNSVFGCFKDGSLEFLSWYSQYCVGTCSRVRQNTPVDGQVSRREPRCRYDQISGVNAAAHHGDLQIRLGDIHERVPSVEAFVNKGIVIAR